MNSKEFYDASEKPESEEFIRGWNASVQFEKRWGQYSYDTMVEREGKILNGASDEFLRGWDARIDAEWAEAEQKKAGKRETRARVMKGIRNGTFRYLLTYTECKSVVIRADSTAEAEEKARQYLAERNEANRLGTGNTYERESVVALGEHGKGMSTDVPCRAVEFSQLPDL